MTQQPIWMDDDISAEAFKAADAKSFSSIKKQTARYEPQIVVNDKRAGGVDYTQVLIRMPTELLERLKSTTLNNHTVAVWALVEQALNEIEEQNEQWTITTNR